MIADYSATSYMVKLEENMMNLKNKETRVSVGDSITLTRGGSVSIGMAARDVTEKSIAFCYKVRL